ncbi:MAG: cation diffusion facilitator family transporter [Rectinema sp.]|nr:cation diffusion facilitator family transporter [Rectinema sp.]
MQDSSRRLGYAEGLISVIINTILFALKLWAGWQASSIAMTADAWHTLSDTLTSLVVILGFWISSRPKDHEHPFGHGRAEVIAALIIATLLAVVGASFLKDSANQLISRHSATYSVLALVIFSVSVIVKEALAQFSIWAGRKTGSRSLMADGWHHRSDAAASLIIVVGGLAGQTLWWLDGALGIAVSLLILYAAFDIAKDAFNALMGERASDSLSGDIVRIARRETPALTDIHHIHIHRYGDHLEVTFHARLNGDANITDAHDLTRKLERGIKEELNADATVHIEPEKTTAR